MPVLADVETVWIPPELVTMRDELVEIAEEFASIAAITEVRLTVPPPDPDAAAVDTAVIV